MIKFWVMYRRKEENKEGVKERGSGTNERVHAQRSERATARTNGRRHELANAMKKMGAGKVE